MKTKNDTTGSIYTQTTTGSKVKFDAGAATITDSRFQLLNKTNKNLTDISKTLTTYLVEADTSITDEKISNAFKTVKSDISTLNNMVDEYKTKSTSAYYDKAVGLNDLFKKMSFYLVNYAKLLSLLNDYLDVDNQFDVKFAMIDLYCNVVSSTFSEIKDSGNLKVVKNTNNIEMINNYFQIEHSKLIVPNMYALSSNHFIKSYHSCNQKVLASSFAETINAVSYYEDSLNYESKAAYFFKQIYNIG